MKRFLFFVGTLAIAFTLSVPLTADAVDLEWGRACGSKLIGVAGKETASLLKANAKHVKKPNAEKLNAAYQKAESKLSGAVLKESGCPLLGDVATLLHTSNAETVAIIAEGLGSELVMDGASRKCSSSKVKAVSKFAKLIAKARGKNLKKLDCGKRESSEAKALDKLAAAFDKADSGAGCVATNDANAVADQVRTLVDELDTTLAYDIGDQYLDNLDGTISDTDTNLMWEKKTCSPGLHNVNAKYTWSGCCDGNCPFPSGGSYCQPNEAAAATCLAHVGDGGVYPSRCQLCDTGACDVDPLDRGVETTVFDWLAQLNIEGGTGFAGHNDWRLPMRSAPAPSTDFGSTASLISCVGRACCGARELEGLRLRTAPCLQEPCIHQVFGPTQLSSYWTSQQHLYETKNVWYVTFANETQFGTSWFHTRREGGTFARAVRGFPAGWSEVVIPDSELRKAMRYHLVETLDKAPDPLEPIYDGELACLTREFRHDGHDNFHGWYPIEDLEGIQYLTRVSPLSLNSEAVTDWSLIGSLPYIDVLVLGGNDISDVSAFAGMEVLDTISLWFNRIVDIGPLTEIPNLRWVYLSYNDISDLTPLANMPLGHWPAFYGPYSSATLVLSCNQISDLSPLVDAGFRGNLMYVNGSNPLSDDSKFIHAPILTERNQAFGYDLEPYDCGEW